jgi:hypothetical protein
MKERNAEDSFHWKKTTGGAMGQKLAEFIFFWDLRHNFK